LQQKTVAYINSDSNARGFLFASGSHTLETLISEVARDVIDPQTKISVFERSKSLQAVNAANSKSKKEIIGKKTLTLGALGSGSDYTPFIQHLGIPSVNLGFGGEGGGGEYHSVYDSYDHFKRFKDPSFDYGIALAKTAGRATLRLAGAEVLPFDFKSFHRTVNGYLDEVMTLLDNLRETTEVENQMIKEKRYELAADPKKTYFPPKSKDPVPFLNFAELQNALVKLEKSATQFSELQAANPKPNTNLANLNKTIYRLEQSLLSEKGLPRRSWYRHTIYAPGFYTGYGVKTLPGIREAIEQRSWQEAQDQIAVASKAIDAYTAQMETASKILMLR
jgi:N-acetylated-alpha-linked acidic dipeptidase